MTSWHHVSELDAINGTKSRPKSQPKLRPESEPSRDQVTSKSSTQLHKISSPQNVNDELTTRQIIYTIHYPLGRELNTSFNPQLNHLVAKIEVNYDN
ncbi:MAG: hypothetical protein PWQ50_1299 [Methanolobus sp.]|jgi:hypothetical protein|nr:hypothetical protein [Methanolobus sp.]